jgi:aspartyl protease family protein
MHDKIFKLFILVILAILMGDCGRKSGRMNRKSTTNYNNFSPTVYNKNDSNGKSIVNMESENGVKYIWVEINGLKLKFVFDTGASSICISAAEATVLYRQGTLKSEDILDFQYFQDATGRVSSGTKINLREVKIGNRVLRNIEAIVIDNDEAPLLFGQSALEKFGKISIDNNNNVIIFE